MPIPLEIFVGIVVIMLIGYGVGKISSPNEKPCAGNYEAKTMFRRR